MNSKAATNFWLRRGLEILLIALLATGLATQAQANNDRWAELKNAYFGDRDIASGDKVITMEAPGRAHDAATVPIVIRAVDLDRRIRQVHLFVDMNPLPLAGIFKFHDLASHWEWLETRIRINEYTHVRAIAELGDGSLHMTSRFVKAAGGCSAPAMADMELAMKHAGRIKLMFETRSDAIGPSAEAVIKISHPNNSGMQFDQISRNYIPAFFVQNISAEIDGQSLIDVETNFSLSENPVLRLSFKSDLGTLQSASTMRVYAIDSKGNRYEKSLEVKNNLLSLQ